MPEDHITGLAEAIDRQDDDAAKRHLVGLARQVLDAFQRATAALEEIAAQRRA